MTKNGQQFIKLKGIVCSWNREKYYNSFCFVDIETNVFLNQFYYSARKKMVIKSKTNDILYGPFTTTNILAKKEIGLYKQVGDF